MADTASVQALEANQECLMEICATLAPLHRMARGRPGDIGYEYLQFSLRVCVQVAFKMLADRYGIFSHKTRKKTIKVGESIMAVM